MNHKFTTPRTFSQWQAFSRVVGEMAERVHSHKLARAYALGATVGLPACANSIHNAACDDAMTGWCHRNPLRLRVAKRVNHTINDWTASQIAGRVSSRAWNAIHRGLI